MSVRQTEQRARLKRNGGKHSETSRTAGTSSTRKPNAAAKQVEEQLRQYLQTDVHIDLAGEDKGSLRISFYSAEDLERLMDLIVGDAREEFR